MKRLIASIAGTAMVLGGLVAGSPPASASTTWMFPTASFTIADGSGSTATVTIQNLRITDGSTASAYVQLAAVGFTCSTSSFTGLDANFFVGTYEPCRGSVSFSVSARGDLSVTTALIVTSHIFSGPATGSAQGTKSPPDITCTAALDGSTGARITFTDPGTGATAWSASASPALPASATQVTAGTEVTVSGLEAATSYTFTITGSGSSASPGTCQGTVTTPAVPIPPVGQVSYGVITGPSTSPEREYSLTTDAPTPSGWNLVWSSASGTPITAHGSANCNTSAIAVPQWQQGSTLITGARLTVSPPCSVATPTLVDGSISRTMLTINYVFLAGFEPGTVVHAKYQIQNNGPRGDVVLGAPPAAGSGGAASFPVPGLKAPAGVWVQLYAVNGPITSPASKQVLIAGEKVTAAFTLSYGQATINALVGATILDAPVITPSTPGVDSYTTVQKLPAGISLDPRTGAISGVATSPTNRTQVAIVATQTSTGNHAATILTFVITAAGPATNRYPDVASAPIGVALTIMPSGSTAGQTFALDSASTAAGMRIDASTGEVSWTPTAPVGPRTVTVTVTTNNVAANPSPFTITVVAPLPTSAQAGSGSPAADSPGASTGGAGGSSGSDGAFTFASANSCLAPNGTLYADFAGSVGSTLTMAPNTFGMPLPQSFTVTKGSLPAGVRLDGTYGVISGTPERSNGGLGALEITTTSADGTVRASDVNIAVDDPHHAVNYPQRIVGSIGQFTRVAPLPINAQGRETFSLVCGTVPAGMTLSARTGVISGTPTALDERPIPLRVRMTDSYGWVDSSFIFVVNNGVTPWLSYPEYMQIGVGRKVTIVPTRSGLATAARYWISEGLPKGLHFSTRTGAITGRTVVHDGIIYEPTIMAIGADGKSMASTWVSITVVKPAVPMRVTSRSATKPLTPGKTVVVTKVKHPSYSRLSAKVTCSHCTYTFNKRTGRLVVRVAKGSKKVTVSIIGQPSGARARAAYAGHAWSRAWRVQA